VFLALLVNRVNRSHFCVGLSLSCSRSGQRPRVLPPHGRSRALASLSAPVSLLGLDSLSHQFFPALVHGFALSSCLAPRVRFVVSPIFPYLGSRSVLQVALGAARVRRLISSSPTDSVPVCFWASRFAFPAEIFSPGAGSASASVLYWVLVQS
jgi:hypothetical protein